MLSIPIVLQGLMHACSYAALGRVDAAVPAGAAFASAPR